MTMTAEDWLHEENERLRGKLEVTEAALNAAINKTNWQAVTNKELSATCAERDAAQRELAAYKTVLRNLLTAIERSVCDGSGAEQDAARELLAANASSTT